MITPLALLLILLPPAIVQWRGGRAVLIMVAGLLGLWLFALALWAVAAGIWPFSRAEVVIDSYHVVAQWRYVASLGTVVLFVLAGQFVKERHGAEDRRTTLVLFWLLLFAMAAILSPLTAPSSGLTAILSETGAFVALAGIIGLVHVILLRPALRWIRGSH
ncbi:hypothetical protein [Maritimibacter sp. DP1N21-5]|uniref:hypothetical protein n=1 Tax=Maritimibacter sp. DP1N21-5 TaxID=2836867 RepID=UPI001C47B8A5|nr:hypothetical protein [Maritimibacter sp. DP1N21-5]MBV7410445.1 hypothetical protein [Maritimibacter sp. DP1N21-5]